MNLRAMKIHLAGPFLLLCATAFCLGAGRRQQTVTDRDAYNEGTASLNEGDFTTAETLLFSAVTANDERVQPAALYNLGLARFALGAEALEKGPDAKAVSGRAVSASTGADVALQEGLTAMQRGEQNALIRAYLRGRGARRELKEAMKGLQEALDVYGNVLSRWQRASGDFHSTVELNPIDADAAHNADVVDRHIAKLVDSIQQMQGMMDGMGDQMGALTQMLGQLKGMIPDNMGDPGPGEDGEDWPQGPEPGMEEGKGREGKEMPISPEDAARLLESFQLDRNRTLPMGFEDSAKPDDQNKGNNW
jgi:tetratricopeptide (TPR) repeat protein